MTPVPNATRGNIAALVACTTDDLLPTVYAELKELARRHLVAEFDHATLQATALAHEAYLRLARDQVTWQNKAHFFGAAAHAIRRILVERTRHHRRLKRGGGWEQVAFAKLGELSAPNDPTVVELDAALQELATIDAGKAKLVELHFFGGLTIEQAAHVLGISPRSAFRDWSLARAWLRRELCS